MLFKSKLYGIVAEGRVEKGSRTTVTGSPTNHETQKSWIMRYVCLKWKMMMRIGFGELVQSERAVTHDNFYFNYANAWEYMVGC